MKRLLFSFLFTLLISASAQAQVATTIARAIRGGPTLPATCSPATSGNKADVFVKTGGSAGVYYCSAANTWTALAGGGGGGSPGGSDTQIQYNNAGAFGGITGATTNGTFVTLTSPVFVTPALGTPASGVLTNATGLPISTGVSGLGTGVATALAVNTGSAGAVVLFNGAGGTPSSITLTNGTGLPISTGVSGLGTGVATFLATPSSANLASAVTDETGSGALVFGTSPTFSTGVTFSSAPITISGNISSPAWTTSGIRIKGVAATFTDTTSSGTVAAAYTNVLGGNTIAASSSTTFTDYYTTFINGPTAGTNVTFTRNWALGLSGSQLINVSSANALTVGPNGVTNPTLNVVTNVASAATGLSITGNAAGSDADLIALSPGTNEAIKLRSKGASPLYIQPTGSPGSAGILVLRDGGSATNIFAFRGSGGQAEILYYSSGSVPLRTAANIGVTMGSGLVYGFATTATGTTIDVAFERAGTNTIKITNGGVGATGGGTLSVPATTPAQITANQNNYAPGVGWFQRWSSDASRNITGLAAGVDGQITEIWNVGSNDIVLQNENASSTAANRFTTSTGADLTLTAGKCAKARYDTTSARWRVYLCN